jgi:hypothetical protein
MTAIDGHELWRVMLEKPDYALVYGWMMENHHYVAGIWQHCGAAVGACTDPIIRTELAHHLVEEFNHGRMFRRGIERAATGDYTAVPVRRSRPLPTTVAYVGALRGLAERNWRAYVLALGFLQLTLRAADGGVGERHEHFYDSLTSAVPELEALLAAMRQHDAEDTRLDHGNDTRKLLTLLVERHSLSPSDVAQAALIPQLTWSFLDGVLRHYRHGRPAVLQRLGWHVDD